MRAAFARAFEAKFAPLEGSTKPAASPSNDIEDLRSEDSLSDEDDDDDDAASTSSAFSGFSSPSEDTPASATTPKDTVQVVVHAPTPRAAPALSKAELKAFLSPRVPLPTALTPPTNTRSKPKSTKGHPNADADEEDDDDAPTEALNLQHDLALQRLISESHLLAPASASAAKNQRQRITDVRLQALGARSSLLAQDKMPMAFRQGIAAKKKQREEHRRREAKENGIILEKARVEKTKREVDEGQRKRERGIGGPSVGRFKGGTLQLSRRDLGAIKGPTRGGRGGRGGGGRGGGRGGKKR